MKQLVFGLLLGIFILSACRGTTPVSQPTSISVVEQATSTPSPLPTATPTSIPSETPTASITPLPTISTFTPTFDVSTIITVTPAEKTECPEISVSEIAQSLALEIKSIEAPKLIDVTNDGQPEIILNGETGDGIGIGSIYIYGCQSGSYEILKKISTLEFPSPQLETVQDLNKNGIPEIVTAVRTCGGFGSCWVISIFEWNGETFQNIVDDQINASVASWLDNLTFRDLDNNGTIEVIVNKGLPSHPDSSSDGPWRKFTEIYSWSGKEFAFVVRTLTQPQFRFQAIQDADLATTQQNYEVALSLYQDAIFSDKLDWWSVDRHHYYRNNFWISENSTAEPTPFPDLAEYPRLAAYAYYRIMLIHLVQNHESDAGTVYNTLQQKFGSDPYGHPYVEMSSAFWEAYQSTHKMYDGCAAAIEYAAEHPEILTPLGSDYHGTQSHRYVPTDVCPFR